MNSGAAAATLLPPHLLSLIEAAAEEERRSASELVSEALERYIADREWRKLFAYGEAQVAALGLAEADVMPLIAEYRGEKLRGGA
jgi:metal-responsive CopG/Arc/MetJ family transcriptional regulator